MYYESVILFSPNLSHPLGCSDSICSRPTFQCWNTICCYACNSVSVEFFISIKIFYWFLLLQAVPQNLTAGILPWRQIYWFHEGSWHKSSHKSKSNIMEMWSIALSNSGYRLPKNITNSGDLTHASNYGAHHYISSYGHWLLVIMLIFALNRLRSSLYLQRLRD